jgi:peptidyl-prolyl cis-trans isomerase A (cyclophilin A)
MSRLLPLLCPLLLLVGGCGERAPAGESKTSVAKQTAQAPAPQPLPDIVRVRLETEAGTILLALDSKRAPITTANFVRYVEEGRFDGTSFYRAVPTKGAPERGFIQGGIRRNYRRMFPPIEHEPTSKTGIEHAAGTISMAHTRPGLAMGEFFITTSDMPAMDARGDKPGFAAFGKVVEGMDVVRKILASPTVPNAGRGAMRGQMIANPVAIIAAERAE